jgi:hypothetical protein
MVYPIAIRAYKLPREIPFARFWKNIVKVILFPLFWYNF